MSKVFNKGERVSVAGYGEGVIVGVETIISDEVEKRIYGVALDNGETRHFTEDKLETLNNG